MSVLPVGFGSALGGYQIERSLRFNSADSAYLNRTPSSAGNRKTWTWSAWVKRSQTGANHGLFTAGTSFGVNNNDLQTISFTGSDTLELASEVSGSTQYRLITTQVFRDPSSWYHVLVSFDTTQGTSSNRIKLYINGVQVTVFGTSTYPSQNYDGWINSTNSHRIGQRTGIDLNGYLTEINFIDGQALTPSDFGETDSNTGVWKPKAYTGTYGTNGFYLKFADNSGTTSTTLGKDSSGNGNNWTPNNFSVTAGAGNDSLVDSPTAYGTDTGAGGEVRGNYATLNPLDFYDTSPTNGNLNYTRAAGVNANCSATWVLTSGKWYWEVNVDTVRAAALVTAIGISGRSAKDTANNNLGAFSDQYAYLNGGNKINNGSSVSYGASYTTGDVIGIAYDADAGTVAFYKNGVSQGTAYSSIPTGNIRPMAYSNGDALSFNFGQRAFAYTAPSGFKALCTTNLPTPTIGATSTTQAGKYFTPYLYTADGTSPKSRTGIGFAPDFLWFKSRSTTFSHALYDQVRGTNKGLQTNTTAAENTYTLLSTFGSDGFTTTTDGTVGNILNDGTNTYVTWAWKANGAGSTNTAGTITSTVSANTTSGFSIVTYTGNGTGGATVGHGLGVAPSMIIIKWRTGGTTQDWIVYHASVGATKFLELSTTDAEATSNTRFNDTAPSSTVFTLGTNSTVNASTYTYVAYCFAPVAGYSAFGSYTGNGSTDGPFVYTGFRPKFILGKRSDAANGWFMFDGVRNNFNVADDYLAANASAAEATFVYGDFLSNGFKLRATTGDWNGSGGTIIYAAFAESPFKYALAR